MSIKRKLIFIIMIVSAVTVLLTAGGIVTYQWVSIRDHMVNALSTQGDMIGNNCIGAILFNDPVDAEEVLESLSANPSLIFACIYLPDGSMFATYEREGALNRTALFANGDGHRFGDNHLILFRQIMHLNRSIGTVYLESDLRELRAFYINTAFIVILAILLASAVAFVLSSKLQGMISTPILELAKAAATIGRDKDYSVRASKHSDDEVGDLTTEFNAMLGQIENRDVAIKENEERLKIILDSLQSGVMVIDSETYEVIDANPVATRLIGLPKEGILGQKINKYLCLNDIGDCSPAECIGTGGVTEVMLVDAKNELIPILKNVTTINLGDREHFLETFMDISDRKAAEESMRRFQMVIDSASDAIKFSTFDGAHVYHNKAFSDLFGEIDHDLPGRLFVDEPTGHMVDERIMAGGGWRGEVQMNSGNGQILDIFMRANAFKDRRGKVIGFACIYSDITEHRQALREKEKLEAQLSQAQRLESIGTLAGGVAHDFNNILGSIIGFTELAALEMPEGSPTKHKLGEVLKASNRAKDVIHQILAFSRQTDKIDKAIKVGPIIEEALTLIRASIPATVEIRKDIAEETGAVMMDPSQLHQVIMNLCTNSAHAMQETGGVLELKLAEIIIDENDISALKDLSPGAYIRITVSDTGQGIPLKLIDRIFEPYFTTKKIGIGSGLGLSVVHGIVKNYNGGITIYSEPGEGCTFNVYLPRVDIDGMQEVDKGEEELPKGDEHILFVDDEETLVLVGKEMLEVLGYTVTTRTSSLEALEAFRNSPDKFDLVITDQTMPNMTGEQLTKEIIGIRPDIPVILSTGFSYTMDAEKAKLIGIRSFILKPIALKEIAKTVRSVLGARSLFNGIS